MTSTLLAQKIVSVKLSKSDFEKIKWLRSNNLEKTYQTIASLKSIIKKQEQNKTCRLCLKLGYKKIFGKNQFDVVASIKQTLQIMVTENDGKPQYICKMCETTLRNAEQLRQTAEITQWRLQQELDMVTSIATDCDMKSRHHGCYFVTEGTRVRKEWSCGKCQRIFNTQEAFSEHEKLPTCRGNSICYVCESCGLELKSMTRLKRHRLIHTGSLQHPCARCPYRARTKYALQVHARAHSAHRPLACAHCPATFLSSSNLASHKRRHMPPAYHCHLCDKSFRFKEALQNHLATQHSTAKPYICSACGKAFSTRKMICRHERRVHNRPKMRSGIIPTYLRQQQDKFT